MQNSTDKWKKDNGSLEPLLSTLFDSSIGFFLPQNVKKMESLDLDNVLSVTRFTPTVLYLKLKIKKKIIIIYF